MAIPAAVNHLIFFNAEAVKGRKTKKHLYEWRYGDIHYTVTGDGEPILLVHDTGHGAGLREWENNIRSLSAHYKVYALDLIGHGRSDKPGVSYSAYLYITLINDFIHEIIKQKTYFVGSSHSAAFGVMAYHFQPDLYKKLLLISPTGIGGGRHARHGDLWIKWLLESPLVGTSLYNLFTGRLFNIWFLKNQGYYDAASVGRQVVDRHYYPAHFGGANARIPFAAFASHFDYVDILSKLAKIDIPVHVVWGEQNRLNPIRHFDKASKANPMIGLTAFEKTRLFPHAENPRAFYRVCREFFDK